MAEVIAKSKAHKVFTRLVYRELLSETSLDIDASSDRERTRGEHAT